MIATHKAQNVLLRHVPKVTYCSSLKIWIFTSCVCQTLWVGVGPDWGAKKKTVSVPFSNKLFFNAKWEGNFVDQQQLSWLFLVLWYWQCLYCLNNKQWCTFSHLQIQLFCVLVTHTVLFLVCVDSMYMGRWEWCMHVTCHFLVLQYVIQWWEIMEPWWVVSAAHTHMYTQ